MTTNVSGREYELRMVFEVEESLASVVAFRWAILARQALFAEDVFATACAWL